MRRHRRGANFRTRRCHTTLVSQAVFASVAWPRRCVGGRRRGRVQRAFIWQQSLATPPTPSFVRGNPREVRDGRPRTSQKQTQTVMDPWWPCRANRLWSETSHDGSSKLAPCPVVHPNGDFVSCPHSHEGQRGNMGLRGAPLAARGRARGIPGSDARNARI